MSIVKQSSPQVELILNTNEIFKGGQVTGVFYLKGGWFKYKIQRLECDLIRESQGEKPEVVEPVKTILMSRTIDQNEKTEIPFSYQLTQELQPTSSKITYRLHTRLVCSDDVKSKDHDEIIVRNS
ncbi:sporulation protein [Radiobacillus sp. PE A8.2]|uniref:sporulation protein n=1 Tax=Radiobacillus sp. PE A8.2 TaxID=3380349 RepID=UPI00388E5FF4